MRLFLLGATGRIGTQLVDLGLERGHHLTAFVRSPQKLSPRERLSIVRGDPLDTAQLAAALPGHDAVLSALGVAARRAFRPHTLVADCARHTVEAMLQAKIHRLLVVSAAVLFPEKGLTFAFFRWLLQHVARDLAAMEATVEGSPLEWTVVRPPRLIRADDTRFRTEVNGLPPKGFEVSFRAVASFMIDCAERGAHLRERVGMAR